MTGASTTTARSPEQQAQDKAAYNQLHGGFCRFIRSVDILGIYTLVDSGIHILNGSAASVDTLANKWTGTTIQEAQVHAATPRQRNIEAAPPPL